MNDTPLRFLFPCWDAQKHEWCVFAAQPMGNIYIEGGFSLNEQAVQYVEEARYKAIKLAGEAVG